MFSCSCNDKELLLSGSGQIGACHFLVKLGLCFLLCIAWHFYFITLFLYPVRSFCSSLLSLRILTSKKVISLASFLTSLYTLPFQFVYQYYNTWITAQNLCRITMVTFSVGMTVGLIPFPIFYSVTDPCQDILSYLMNARFL